MWFLWSKEMVEEEWSSERGGVSPHREAGLRGGGGGGVKERGRGGDCAPIHIGGIWLENKLLGFVVFFSVFFFFFGLEKFSSGGLVRNRASRAGTQ